MTAVPDSIIIKIIRIVKQEIFIMEKTPFPNSFDLIALYGRNTGYSDESDDCRIYHLNNETGAGTITIYCRTESDTI